ncbi:MAG: signal peptidase I [Verrucomicrobiota bacterium]
MKQLRKQARELLHAANKIYHYRKDVIPEGRLDELDKAVGEVHSTMKAGAAEQLEAAMKRLDGLLKKIGGKMYPKTFWNDNIEVALVAAIIVIGIRTFFFQPFIIPTNSMYPTYSGMNAVMYEEGENEPAILKKLFRFATLGARHKSVTATTSGNIQIPISVDPDGSPRPYVEKVKGRKFFVLPAIRAQYTLLVDGVPHTITVPAEFDMNSTFAKAFDFSKARIEQNTAGTGLVFNLSETVQAGEDLLRFDITLGDALFVDRFTYHFRKPKAGEPFVFRTDEIQQEIGPFSDDYTNKYYIKRLAGVGGETLEIRDGTLLVDGEPRDEVAAFERNAAREGEYGGYQYPTRDPNRPMPKLLNESGSIATVPEDSYVSLGDNSANSLDSRYWGFVPEKAVIGKAVFIYYPFTKRWGLAE